MESLKKRLGFGNPLFQLQVLHTLQKLVEDKLAQVARAQQPQATAKIPELDVLIELVASEDEALSTPAAYSLCSLVLGRHLSADVCISKLLNSAPLARDFSALCRCISRIVQQQYTSASAQQRHSDQSEEDEVADGLYGTSRVHPFIILLSCHPSASYSLLKEVEDIYTSTDTRVQACAIKITRQFLRFVLLNPDLSCSAIRIGLQYLLIDLWARYAHPAIGDFLLSVVGLMPCDSPSDKQSLSVFVALLIRSFASASHRQRERLFALALSHCDRLRGTHLADAVVKATVTLLTSRDTVAQPPLRMSKASVIVVARLLYFTSPLSAMPLMELAAALLSTLRTLPSCLVAIFQMPLLHISSLKSTGAEWTSQLVSKAADLLRVVKTYTREDEVGSDGLDDKAPTTTECTGDYADSTVASMAAMFDSEPQVALRWLRGMAEFSKQGGKTPISYALLLGAILSKSADSHVVLAALDAIAWVCYSQEELAPSFFPLLMYKLSDARTPIVYLALLTTLPRLASNKLTMPSIAHALERLSHQRQLKPVALRLLARLWQKHDRCFSTLLEMLSTSDDPANIRALAAVNDVDELAVSRAACAANVCRERPHEHGSDVLPVLSDILSGSYNGSRGELACSLALDGVKMLCEKEVVNVKSVWDMLQPQLEGEQRPLVVGSMCHLLSVVSQTPCDAVDYQAFADYVVDTLWDYALCRRSGGSSASGAAYSALSAFPLEVTKYKHLPKEIIALLAPETVAADTSDSAIAAATAIAAGPVNGRVFVVGLLQCLSHNVASAWTGYSKFLTANISREVSNLPRSVLSRFNFKPEDATPQRALTKSISLIPTRLVGAHRAAASGSRSRGSLANALLYCYHPRLADGNVADGSGAVKPRDHVLWMRTYEKALQGFLLEVPSISSATSDWHRSLQLPHAWQSFMSRMLAVTIAGRRAELAMQVEKAGKGEALQQQHQRIRDARQPTVSLDCGALEEDAQQSEADLVHWCRGRLHDVIKTASRQSRAAQANAVLAQAALCCSLIDSGYALGKDDGASSESRGRLWLREYLDSLLATVATGPADALEGSGGTENDAGKATSASSWLAANSWPYRGAACLALAHVAGALQSREGARVTKAVCLLRKLFADAQGGDEEFFYSASLGRLLSILFEHSFSDVMETEMAMLIWETVDMLEDHCLGLSTSPKWCAKGGCASLFGLVLCEAAIGRCRQPQARAHLRSIFRSLLDALVSAKSGDSSRCAALQLSVASVACSLYVNNAITLDEIKAVIQDVLASGNVSNQLWAMAIGLFAYTMNACQASDNNVLNELQKVTGQWELTARVDDSTSENRAAAFSGLLASAGCEEWLSKILPSELSTRPPLCSLDTIASALGLPLGTAKTHQKKGGTDERQVWLEAQTGLHWLLGRVHSSAASGGAVSAGSSGQGPASYRNALPPASLLRSIVEALSVAGTARTSVSSTASVGLLLRCLTEGAAGRALPPLDWTTILSPLIRWPAPTDKAAHDTCLDEACVRFASEQARHSHSCAVFLAHWCAPHLFDTLRASCQDYLLRNFHKFSNFVPRERAEEFLKKCCVPIVKKARRPSCEHVLRSCKDALAECATYAPGMQLLYYQTMELLFAALSPVNRCPEEMMSLFADCLLLMEDTFLERVLSSPLDWGSARREEEEREDARKCWRVQLLLVGRGRLPLADVVNVTRVIDGLRLFPAYWFLSSIADCLSGKRENREKMDWLMCFCGDLNRTMKKIATTAGRWSQELDELLCVFVAAIAAWSSAVPWGLLCSRGTEQQRALLSAAALPQLLLRLVANEPWSQLAPKIFDWLVDTKSVCNSTLWHSCFQAAILTLRRCTFFQKQQLWEQLPRLLPQRPQQQHV